MERWQVIASGHVQGVGFRASAQNYALRLGLTGYAQNLASGQVRMEVQGMAEQLQLFYTQIQAIPPGSQASLQFAQMAVQEGEAEFVIKV